MCKGRMCTSKCVFSFCIIGIQNLDHESTIVSCGLMANYVMVCVVSGSAETFNEGVVRYGVLLQISTGNTQNKSEYSVLASYHTRCCDMKMVWVE